MRRPATRSSSLNPDGAFRRPHEGTEDPENREEDPEEEQPSVPVSQRHDAERDEQDDVQDAPTDANSPPHDSSLAADFLGSLLHPRLTEQAIHHPIRMMRRRAQASTG